MRPSSAQSEKVVVLTPPPSVLLLSFIVDFTMAVLLTLTVFDEFRSAQAVEQAFAMFEQQSEF